MINHLFRDEPMNTSLATAASTSPLWLWALQETSEVAALLLPVAGILWFAVQIYFHIRNKGKR